jgi:hypothetical protein
MTVVPGCGSQGNGLLRRLGGGDGAGTYTKRLSTSLGPIHRRSARHVRDAPQLLLPHPVVICCTYSFAIRIAYPLGACASVPAVFRTVYGTF